jgi:hypothetical protein
MVRLVRQSTRLERFAKALAAALFGQLRGSWRRRSALILALLLGFYAGNNVTAYLLWRMPGGRPAMVLATVLMLEVIVRLRERDSTTGVDVVRQPAHRPGLCRGARCFQARHMTRPA